MKLLLLLAAVLPVTMAALPACGPANLELGRFYCLRNRIPTCQCPNGGTCTGSNPQSPGNRWCLPNPTCQVGSVGCATGNCIGTCPPGPGGEPGQCVANTCTYTPVCQVGSFGCSSGGCTGTCPNTPGGPGACVNDQCVVIPWCQIGSSGCATGQCAGACPAGPIGAGVCVNNVCSQQCPVSDKCRDGAGNKVCDCQAGQLCGNGPDAVCGVVGRTCAAPNDLYLGKLYCVKNNFRTCDCPYGKTCPPPPPGSRGNQWCQPV